MKKLFVFGKNILLYFLLNSIICLGTLVVECQPLINKMRGGDNDENKDFCNKSFKTHLRHLITFYLIGISNKKIDTHHH